ncbi:MAG: glycosyltransferase, partial [Pontimonas sp.]|nr:glycosyltransferase [Pontimonas sp.]
SREVTEGYFPHLEHLERARERWPLVTVIVPARDEETTITDTISGILDIDWPQLEVIVVDDGSVDATAKKLEAFATNKSVPGALAPGPAWQIRVPERRVPGCRQ